ncbi:lipopolysaccharide biosynthesis protein [Oceanobacillus oncorhynchi]|uniref:lipopolysaccharide biosynthesis protein n=1 Tax=Oceanobacillus oncorhynchi TaxID=545501 RepID=UPI001868C8E8|nr:oligosaccharide flippase family protein [Oceanobacillus oncorhynchi]
MNDKIKKIIKKPFIRNVLILSSGTAVAQIINMILAPLITRLYGPEAYGLMGTFVAITLIIAPIAALTYPIAIVLPKDNEESKGLIKLSLRVTLINSIIALLVLLFFHKPIVNILGLEELGYYLYFLPIVLLLAGISQIIEQHLIRNKQFRVSAKATFYHALLLNGGKASIGLFYPVTFTLIVFSALTYGIKSLLLVCLNSNSKDKIFSSQYTQKDLKKLRKKYKDFPIYRAPEVFLNAISGNLPTILLTMFFGPASAGFYTIGRTVLNIPSQLIGKSVGDVFYPRISEAKNNNENVPSLIVKATLSLAVLGAIPFGIVVAFGPWLFEIVFGSDWIVAGEYARWIALWSYFGFMNQPSVKSLPVLSAQKFHLFYTIFMLITRIVMLFIGFYIFESDIVAIAIFALSGGILNIGLIILTIMISIRTQKNY